MSPSRSVARVALWSWIVFPRLLPAQTSGALRGSVRLPDGSGAVHAVVALEGLPDPRTMTDSGGRFVLTGVPPGRQLVVASLEGWNPTRARVTVAAGDTVAVELTLRRPLALAAVEVTGARGGYIADSATSGTKTDAPIRDVPQAIEVRTREMLNDLGGEHTSYEVGKTVAGVFNASNGQGDPGRNVPNLVMRGFSSSSYLKDGHTVNGWMSTMDMANIDRVEFLKGPASVLYGGTTYGGEIGGVVNYVSKRPQATSIAAPDITVGNDQFYRGTMDWGGALNSHDAVLWRLNGAVESGGSPIDYAKHNTQMIAPAITLKMSSRDVLTVLIDAVHSHEVPAQGLPISLESLAIPYSRNFIDPVFAHTDIQAQNVNATYDHRFADAWHATLDAHVSRSRTNSFGTSLSYVSDSSTLTGSHWNFDEDQTSLDLRLNGRVHTGPLSHNLLVGYNLLRNRYNTVSEFGWGGPSLDVPGDSLGVLTMPAAGAMRTQYLATVADPGNFRWKSHVDAIYLQDLVSVGHHVKILAGLRYDHFTDDYLFSGSFGAFADVPTNSHASPRAGLVVQPTRALSLYVEGAQAFTPNAGLTLSGVVPPPELGWLAEVGAKWAPTEGLRANLSLYTLKRSHMTFSDPADPTGNAVLVAGGTQSHGIELDVDGVVGEHWRISAAGSLMNGWISAGEPGGSLVVGQEFAGIPHRTVNLFAVYSGGGNAGWEFGGGPYYAAAAWADDANTFKLPALLQLDAFAARRIGARTQVQINVKNLANRRDYTSNGWGWIFPGAVRSVFATLRHDF